MKALLQKLLTIQKSVDHVIKTEKGFNYSYAGQEQVLNTIRPLMNDEGLLLVQEVLEVENTRIDYTTGKGEYLKDKSEILTSASQRFTWIDVETGDKLEALFHANGMNNWEQGLGSALTYGERYFLLKFFHIPTPNDDPDKRQQTPETTPSPPKEASKPQTEPEGMDIPLAVRNSNTVLELEVLWSTLNKEQQTKNANLITIRKNELS